MLEFNNVSLTLKKDGRSLIKNFTFTLKDKDKIAIIGEEGNGKSTLLKAVVDKDSIKPYVEIEGAILTKDLHIGYLEQFLDEKWNDNTVMDYFLKRTISSEVDLDRYDLISDIYELFSKFKLNISLLEDNHLIKTLSGGEKIKLQLIKILTLKPDVLLLDEPTNDIDIPTLEWLENFINNSSLPILFISHDETLLENCANGIIHLEQIKKKTESRYTIERIPYKEYMEKRLGLLTKQEQIARKQRSDYQKQMEGFRQVYQKVEYQQRTITRADPHGAALLKKKMKSLKSQERRYEKEQKDFIDIPDVEDAIFLKIGDINAIPDGKTVLDMTIDNLEVKERVLAHNIKLNIRGKEHVVIVGQNGIGKSTLIKKIYELLKDRKDIKVGYMPQNYDDMLDLEKTPLEFLIKEKTKDDETLVRTYLGSLKFTLEEVSMKMKNLSGGQRAKVLLLSLVLNKNNVLILDEPTRNLSPLSNPVIRNMLANFEGAIISISHDRKYINEVCDKIYELTKEGLIMH